MTAKELLAGHIDDLAVGELGLRSLLAQPGAATNEVLRKVDGVLRYRVARLLRFGASGAELDEEIARIEGLLSLRTLDSEHTWLMRWRALADLLSTQAHWLEARDPKGALTIPHAQKILGHVRRHPGLSQTELAEALRLGPANLSRLLGMLEGHGLLFRRQVGRKKLIFPVNTPT